MQSYTLFFIMQLCTTLFIDYIVIINLYKAILTKLARFLPHFLEFLIEFPSQNRPIQNPRAGVDEARKTLRWRSGVDRRPPGMEEFVPQGFDSDVVSLYLPPNHLFADTYLVQVFV